ncbi:hypothetical protein [Marinobacter sp. F3R11]|uniref:hypothetical protein n=1 Tax=Marinobacter sp. F3R11 TaxID=2267231 RepID=UPI0021C972A7|nr:hypothetical protein [Marinobacter sp. F3R11]
MAGIPLIHPKAGQIRMSEDPLKVLSDMASDAHARIQTAHQHINPVVEVRRGMRDAGIPADVMTIDCLRTRRRITLILHDNQPGLLLYQFVTIENEVGNDFKQMAISDLNTDTLFCWMQDYFG